MSTKGEFINSKMIQIIADFKNNINSMGSYCFLKNFRFDNQTPDYNNILIQQYYLLKYIPAYFLEYYFMYDEIVQSNFLSYYNIISFGCGSDIDYWSSVYAISEKFQIQPNQFYYMGIDRVNWFYKEDFNNFIKNDYNLDIGVLAFPNNYLSQNIFFFPKSLGEFDENTFFKLLNFFESSCLTNNKIIVAASLRKKRMNLDLQRLKMITEILISKHNYKQLKPVAPYYSFDKKQDGSDYFLNEVGDGDISYPIDIKEYLTSFCYNCQSFSNNKQMCIDCRNILTRKPITTTSQIMYNIIKLER